MNKCIRNVFGDAKDNVEDV